MTPDPIPPAAEDPPETRSTAGMTTKVVKGSLWTLAGQIAPMMVALVATPFTIRFLGSESYGVLIFVGLISGYLTVAEFGMAVASTKFASEAFGDGDPQKESRIVWTAATIAAVSVLLVAVPTFLFANWIVEAFHVPETLLNQASIAVRISAAGSFFIVLSLVLNSPMLARLRMDLNTVTQAVPKILLAAATPVILYFGGGIVGAVSWVFIVAVATVITVTVFSGRLLPEIFRPSIELEMVKPLFRYGGAWFTGVVASVLIGNLDKVLLTSLVSVRALAYYSIAFTFANVATLFSQAMLQSLLPAFSQMMAVDRRSELSQLFSRGVRVVIIALIPMVLFLFVIGRPFLTLWAGEEFGAKSSVPFYVLLGGFSLSIFSVLPYSILLAAGRTDYFAKMYWIELPFYAILAWLLISRYEITGAALAYAIRTVFDALWAIVLCNRLLHLPYNIRSFLAPCILAILVLLPVLFIAVFDNFSVLLVPASLISFGFYALIVWKKLLDRNEKIWLSSKIGAVIHA